jgi:hypothetical protein
MNKNCRFCQAPLLHHFADLGMSPLSNSYLKAEDLDRMEPFYPLTAYVCESCFLVQLPAVETPEAIFSDYAYFSSFSDSWLQHAKTYCEKMTEQFRLGPSSQVIEIASNDGYLLQYFKQAGIPALGIEPAANVAEAAREKGIDTRVAFFGTASAKSLVREGVRPDLLLGNNVLAHVPDLNDFVAGLKILLALRGTITMEFPHLMQLMLHNQFDTIYHEHFSYFSFTTVRRVFAAHGLELFDVEELPTHGGSLRIYGRHAAELEAVSSTVEQLVEREREFGLGSMSTYSRFAEAVRATKRRLLSFLITARENGKLVVGYGAPAKGNTLLNYCGIRTDLIAFTVDRSPHKQERFLPGTRIPIYAPSKIAEAKPDYILILPWNLRREIMEQMKHVREWGCEFVVPIPTVEVVA